MCVCVCARARASVHASVCACMCIHDGGMLIACVKKDVNSNALRDIHTAIAVS